MMGVLVADGELCHTAAHSALGLCSPECSENSHQFLIITKTFLISFVCKSRYNYAYSDAGTDEPTESEKRRIKGNRIYWKHIIMMTRRRTSESSPCWQQFIINFIQPSNVNGSESFQFSLVQGKLFYYILSFSFSLHVFSWPNLFPQRCKRGTGKLWNMRASITITAQHQLLY